MKAFYFLCAAALVAPLAQAQQLRLPAASPRATSRQEFSTSFVSLDYSRPAKKSREIFGKLVPYDVVWRTGANTVTKIRFGEEVTFGGQKVAAGAYALLSIPAAKEWTLILNKDTAQWGAYSYKPELDVVRVKAKATSVGNVAENLSLTLENLQSASAELTLRWDKTQVAVPILADANARVLAQIQEAMKGEKKPYMSAAQYYYNSNNPDLPQALTWIDEAIKLKPSYSAYYWKARVLQRAKRNPEAAEAARQSLELVKLEKNEVTKNEYTRLSQQVLAEVGKK
jgi:tetratricopeptide (TPR) repeat protein